MTEHLKEMTYRSRAALPRNRFEMAAWLLQKGGMGFIFLFMLVAVWWNGERHNDEMRDLVRANVEAFKQVSSDLQSQRADSESASTRLREDLTDIMSELRASRRLDPAATPH